MPSTEEILRSLKFITNNYILVSMGWHVAIYVLITLMLFKKVKPSTRFLAVVSGLPLFSVAIFAWLSANPFNGVLFSAAGLYFLLFALKPAEQKLRLNPSMMVRGLGLLISIVGLTYPHFLERDTISYLYAAPTGLIPCPTLLLMTGAALFFDLKQTRSWSIGLVVIGLFYGAIGSFRLHVNIDVVLLIASFALVANIFIPFRAHPKALDS